MPYVSQEEIQTAKQVDLLSFLQATNPSELVHVSGQTYCTREHDSLKISNGKWYWFSRGIGGVSALDYLIKVQGYSLPQAVELIGGRSSFLPPKQAKRPETPRRLLLPERNNSSEQVIRYLRRRGIHPEVIGYCIENTMLYESKDYHNAVFVGYDEGGKPRYASIRGTIGKYKGEATGSDKHYSFGLTEGRSSSHLHLFESAIDLLSFVSILHMKGQDWNRDAFLSLAGVFQSKRQDVFPVALQRYLDQHKEVQTIHLHLDNDEVGRGAAEGIKRSLAGRYSVLDEPPACGKDVNDQLMIRLGLKKSKEEHER